MKILVPIDGSTYSENSLSFVASRTSLLGHNPEIELLVVLDPLPARAARLVGKDSLSRYYEEEAEKIFEPARKFLSDKHIAVNEAFMVGDPSEKIAEEAVRLDADLVIMGSRGRTALAGLFLPDSQILRQHGSQRSGLFEIQGFKLRQPVDGDVRLDNRRQNIAVTQVIPMSRQDACPYLGIYAYGIAAAGGKGRQQGIHIGAHLFAA